MPTTRSTIVWFAVSTSGCLGQWAGSIPPANPASLACSLNELSRLGYLISSPAEDPGWQQVYRQRGGGGDEIWIRLVNDGRHAPWLDLRVNSWNQFPQPLRPNGDTRPFSIRSEQAQEDVRTVRDACEGSRKGVVARRP